MPSGVPLTPDQIAKLVETFNRTASYAKAGRAIGVGKQTAKAAIDRVLNVPRRTLYARACDDAIVRAHAAVTRTTELLRNILDPTQPTEALGIEPRDIAALTRAQCDNARVLVTLREHEDTKRQSRLTREKTRADIGLTEARTRTLADWDVLLQNATPDELKTLDLIRRATEARAARRAETDRDEATPTEDA